MLDDQIRLKKKINIEKSLALLEQKMRSKKSSNKNLEKKGRKSMEKKIMYFSLIKSYDKL